MRSSTAGYESSQAVMTDQHIERLLHQIRDGWMTEAQREAAWEAIRQARR